MIMGKWVNIMSKFDKYRWKLETATKIEKRKVKNGKLILKPFIVSRDETGKFEKKELEKSKKRKKDVKNSWFDRLINYIPKPIK